jgi:hypothetical protein
MKRTPLRRFTSLRTDHPLKRTGKLNAFSSKRKSRSARRAECWRIVRERAGGLCEMRTPVCVGLGTHPHEVIPRGRGGDDTDPGNCLWSCWPCNCWAHDHPTKASERGLLRSNPRWRMDSS